MIIDYRLRPPYEGYVETQMYEQRWVKEVFDVIHLDNPDGPESARKKSMPLLIEEMDEAGITIGVTQGRFRPGTEIPNEALNRLVQEYPGRFVALGSVNVLDVAAAQKHIEEVVRYKFPGIALDLSVLGMNVDDRRMYPIYELVAAAKLSVTITLSMLGAKEVSLVRPEGIDRAARDFPSVIFVSAHGSFPYVLEIIGVAMKRRNVWLSPDMYMTHFPGRMHYVEAANGYLRDRMLFGTAYPYTPLKETLDKFLQLPLEREVQELMLYRNAQRLLHLPGG